MRDEKLIGQLDKILEDLRKKLLEAESKCYEREQRQIKLKIDATLDQRLKVMK